MGEVLMLASIRPMGYSASGGFSGYHLIFQTNRMPCLYILECADGTYYTGSTPDLERRLIQHGAGEGANYTAKRLPIRLVYSEEFVLIGQAFKREKQIQAWSHEKKKALIEGDLERLKEGARKRRSSSSPPEAGVSR